jgi:hypothetical protein
MPAARIFALSCPIGLGEASFSLVRTYGLCLHYGDLISICVPSVVPVPVYQRCEGTLLLSGWRNDCDPRYSMLQWRTIILLWTRLRLHVQQSMQTD